MPSSFDFAVIGGGMAGASIAAELSKRGRVILIERESQPGYHATGRSAALFSELYGNATIRSLTRSSREFFLEPDGDFVDQPLATPRGTVFFGTSADAGAIESLVSDCGARRLDPEQAFAELPLWKPDYVAAAAYEAGSFDIDVHGLLHGYLRQLRRSGGQIVLGGRVRRLTCRNGVWKIQCADKTFEAPVVVNAAGAWADAVATTAGVSPCGLKPCRRTAVLIDVPQGLDAASWPAAIHIAETFYFKPDAGLLLLSPADEHPSEPCDAQPEELDIAHAVARFEAATGHGVSRLRGQWAGLRTFSADRTPVVGFDETAPGFFWYAGQGGYGIQTAPALARLAGALACGEPLPDGPEIEAALLDPGRTALQRKNHVGDI